MGINQDLPTYASIYLRTESSERGWLRIKVKAGTGSALICERRIRMRMKKRSYRDSPGAVEGLQARDADRHQSGKNRIRIRIKVKLDPDPHQQFQIRVST